MKNLLHYIAITLILSSLLACKKKKESAEESYTCTTCASNAEALAANNASSKGIYKGIVIGSTGTVKFDISNAGSAITATLVLDGLTTILTSTVTWTANQAYLGNFSGTYLGNPISIGFSVGSTGGSPTVTNSNIPGHANAVFSVYKEGSDNLIECFEGNYSTTRPESGTFNLILSKSLKGFTGTSRPTGTTENNKFSGSLNNGQILDEQGRFMGTLNGDKISGQFKDNSGSTVTISAKRTL